MQDIGAQLKEKIKPLEDEMTFNEYADEAKVLINVLHSFTPSPLSLSLLQELITTDTEAKFEKLLKQTAVMIGVMTNMLNVAQNMETRNQQLQQDMSQLADTIKFVIGSLRFDHSHSPLSILSFPSNILPFLLVPSFPPSFPLPWLCLQHPTHQPSACQSVDIRERWSLVQDQSRHSSSC